VVLRRAPTKISVSIIPSEDRKPSSRQQLLEFVHELESSDQFPTLFEVAHDLILSGGEQHSFRKDILRIEVCGPEQSPLTLVDLPGLIHSETKLQTAEDIKVVAELVDGYLNDPRSIVLAIVSAKNDIGNQVILRKAREADPNGQRTLGIITKPDTLSKGSKSEKEFVHLAQNENVKFRLGWHVVGKFHPHACLNN
jgi:hypothetical protein